MTDGMQASFNEGATGSGQEVPWWTVSVFSNLIVWWRDNNDVSVSKGIGRGLPI